jgi:hypothetical protein
MPSRPMSIVMEEVTDPERLAQAERRHTQFERNLAWFHTHAAAIYAAHRGQHICIAGEHLFVAATPEAVLAAATQAYPEDEGRFTLYVPQEKLERIYAA